jgi:hypothetical protein
MDSISFWIGWLGLWLTIFLSITGLLVAFACGERERIHNYIHGAPTPHPTAEAVGAAVRMADFIFGERLFYGWGFVTSVLFSTIVATICFAAAWIAMPLLRAEHTRSDHLALATPEALTALLTLGSIAVEYLFVAKSRFLLARIKDSFPAWKLLLVLAGDIISTVLTFLIVTPALLTIVALSFPLFFHDIESPEIGAEITSPEVWASGAHTVSWARDPYVAYPMIASMLAEQVQTQVAHPLRQFHTLTIYRKTGTPGCVGAGTKEEMSAAQGADERHCAFTAQGVEYLTTIMLVTAFATTLWVSFTAITILSSRALARSIISARTFLVWLYDHPNVMIGCWIACWPLCFLSGELIAHTFLGRQT